MCSRRALAARPGDGGRRARRASRRLGVAMPYPGASSDGWRHLGPLATISWVPLSLGLTAGVWALRPVGSLAFDLYARISPEGDRRVFAHPEIKAMFLDDLFAGSRRGIAAPILDFLLFARSWGFSVREHHCARALVARRRRHLRAPGPRPTHGVADPRRRALRATGREPSRRVRRGRGGAHDVARCLGRAQLRQPSWQRISPSPTTASFGQDARRDGGGDGGTRFAGDPLRP